MVGKLETRSVGALRTRWAAIGAAVAVTFGAGGMIAVNAAPEPPYSSDAGAFVVLEQPVRLLDTRVSSQPYVYCDNGGGSEPMGPVTDGDTCILDFAANGQVPWNPSLEDDECADTDVCTTAVVLNLTAVNPESKGFATITQGCNGLIGNTDTSNLNWGWPMQVDLPPTPGGTPSIPDNPYTAVANQATTSLCNFDDQGANGSAQITVTMQPLPGNNMEDPEMELLVDLLGYYVYTNS